MRLALALLVVGGCVASHATVESELPIDRNVDLLFVIQNSARALGKQTALDQAFPQLVAALDALPGGRPNLHVAFVDTTVDIGTQGFGPGCPSPDVGDDGLFQSTAHEAGCSAPSGRFITDVAAADGARTVNYGGTLDAELSCIGLLGSTGCGFEAPLEAMKRALDGTRPENAGFLRPGAVLAVVILTDEDDCSARDDALFSLPDAQVGGRNDFRCSLFAYTCDTPISATDEATYAECKVREGSYLQSPGAYFDFLSTLVEPSRIVATVIAGDPTSTITMGPIMLGANTQPLALLPSCTFTVDGNAELARPAIRLDDFVDHLGDRGSFQSVCQSEYGATMLGVAAQLATAIGP